MRSFPSLSLRSVASGNADHGGNQRVSRKAMSLAGRSADPAGVVMRPIDRQPQSENTRPHRSQRQLQRAKPPASLTDRSRGGDYNPP